MRETHIAETYSSLILTLNLSDFVSYNRLNSMTTEALITIGPNEPEPHYKVRKKRA